MQKHFFVLVGTRPEAIKLFPVINRLKAEKSPAVTVCATAQHRELLDQVLKLADIVPDIDLNIMTANQTLGRLSGRLRTPPAGGVRASPPRARAAKFS